MKTEAGEDKRKELTYDDNIRLFDKVTYAESELSAKNRNLATSFEFGIENKINTSFMTFRAEEAGKESIVNKFIPFEGTGTSEN